MRNRPTIKTVENQREFCKLFKIKIPVHEHFDYYIELLFRAGQMDIYDLIRGFNAYVDWVATTEYSSVVKYKLSYALPKAVSYVKGTKSYALMQEEANKLKTQDFRSKDHRKVSLGITSASIDMVAANFSCLCYYDEHEEFQHDWYSFIEDLDIHPFLAKSKSFRQYIFGNTNPKMFAKLQKEFIWNLREHLINVEGLDEEELIFISHDELIVSMQGMNSTSLLKKVHSWAKVKEIKLRVKLYREDRIDDITVRQNFALNTMAYTDKELVGVEGSKTFWALKKYVLEEELDPRDLLFKQNDSIATWVLGGNDRIVRTLTVRKRGFAELLDEKIPEVDEELRKKVVSLAIHFFQGSNYD